MKTLYYLGPENTYSHAAARLASQTLEHLHKPKIEPLPSATLLFETLKESQPSAEIGVIVPIYNLEQGIVYDFAHFAIFCQLGYVQLRPDFNLYSQQTGLNKVKTVYTKDTVIPQISRQLAALPKHITIQSSASISTAKAAKLAQEDVTGAAICSKAAGERAKLNLLVENMTNNRESYTEFAIFSSQQVSQTTQFTAPLFTSAETPYRVTSNLFEKLRTGNANLLWRIAADQHPALHMGHIRNLEKLARYQVLGNRVHIMVDISHGGSLSRAEGLIHQINQFCKKQVSPPPIFNGQIWNLEGQTSSLLPQEDRADIRGLSKKTGQESIRLLEVERIKSGSLYAFCQEQDIDFLVGGTANQPTFDELIQRLQPTRDMGAILINYLPGTNRYAKMSTHRGNHAVFIYQ